MAGLVREPKWSHLKELHKAIKMCEPALVSVDPTVTWLGKNQEVADEIISSYNCLKTVSNMIFFRLVSLSQVLGHVLPS